MVFLLWEVPLLQSHNAILQNETELFLAFIGLRVLYRKELNTRVVEGQEDPEGIILAIFDE